MAVIRFVIKLWHVSFKITLRNRTHIETIHDSTIEPDPMARPQRSSLMKLRAQFYPCRISLEWALCMLSSNAIKAEILEGFTFLPDIGSDCTCILD